MRSRRTRTAIVTSLVLSLVTAIVSGTAAATTPARASGPTLGGGHTIVQFAETSPMPLPWNAHLLGADPTVTTASGPRAAADADGGIQLTFRSPQGDVVWMDGGAGGQFQSVDLTTDLGLPPAQGVPVPAVSARGLDEVYFVTTGGRLYQLTWDPYLRVGVHFGDDSNRLALWYPDNLTAIGGLQVAGTPSVVVDGSTTDVFARTTSGDLVEYESPGVAGSSWSAYDLTVEAGGPKVSTDPAAFHDTTTGEVRVAETELSPSPGHVVVYSPTDVGGRVWTAEDVTKSTSTPVVSGGLAAVMDGPNPVLFGAGPTGDLLEYEGTDSGTTTSWLESDVTASTQGSPQIVGTPAASVSGTKLVVAGVAASWGDLFEWTQTTKGGPFVATDVSITGLGPARTIAGTPAVAFSGSKPSIFGAGVGVPAPEGTGVYAIPSSKWSQAVKDGWPVLGVTGGLGTTCAPWTGYVTPPSQTSAEPDEFVGQAIQQSHVRETWLSFWTVSGPGTQGVGCASETPPFTTKTFYLHGYDAGQWVASQIDGYRSQGLGLKPDWVIFDPEGYPDDHSGLWGPTSPASALATSVADWYAILAGWKAGLDSVDPSLRAAVYANQYEYMTYRLFGQPLPAFIAGAFAEQGSGATRALVPPTRSAYGANIRGFVMFNENFTPTCTQVDAERQLLTAAPWDGSYNTIQVPAGTYCPPGQSAG